MKEVKFNFGCEYLICHSEFAVSQCWTASADQVAALARGACCQLSSCTEAAVREQALDKQKQHTGKGVPAAEHRTDMSASSGSFNLQYTVCLAHGMTDLMNVRTVAMGWSLPMTGAFLISPEVTCQLYALQKQVYRHPWPNCRTTLENDKPASGLPAP